MKMKKKKLLKPHSTKSKNGIKVCVVSSHDSRYCKPQVGAICDLRDSVCTHWCPFLNFFESHKIFKSGENLI